MEIIAFTLIGFIVGFCIGNHTIRTKIAEEIRFIVTKKRPEQEETVVVSAKYRPKKMAETEAKAKEAMKATKEPAPEKPKEGGCNKCGGHVEPVKGMEGYYFCEKCNSITSKTKEKSK